MEVVNAEKTGALFCEVLWNQELVLETVIQLIFLGLECRFFTTVAGDAVKKGKYSGFESTKICLNYFVVLSRQVFIFYK